VTADMETSIRASRRRVARSRGALSGVLLVILGLWAALVPFIGPYLNLAYTPKPNDAWHWTAARGWLEVLPGAAVLVGGLLLLLSASRAMTVFGGWLAALGGAWLIVGPPLSGALNLNAGQPDPSMGTNARAAIALLFFYATGAVILFFASVALGRVSVLSVRDVRAAERRAEAAEAERQAALEAAAREERENEEAGRHAERPGDVRDARDDRPQMPPHQPIQPTPQFAGGPQQPAGRNGHTGRTGPDQPYPTTQYPPQGPGQNPSQYPPANPPTSPPTSPPNNPTTQYPSAPPPRE